MISKNPPVFPFFEGVEGMDGEGAWWHELA